MSPPALPRPGRPGPVSLAGPPLTELAAQAAKGWLLALLEDRPLSASGEVRVSALAEEGPDLCHAVLRAVGSEEELEWLTGAEQGRRLAAQVVILAGSSGPQAAVAGVEALRRGLRDALVSSSGLRHAALLAEAGDRLAYVCARLAAVAVVVEVAEDGPPRSGPAKDGHHDGLAERGHVDDGLAELAAAAQQGGATGFTSQPERGGLQRVSPDAASRPLWMAALERQLAEGGRSGRRFALALIDVDGTDRLRLAEPGPVVGDLLAGVGRTVREHVRRADLLAHEDDGRMWVIAPDAGRTGGRVLAARVAQAVHGAGRRHGASLTVSIGLAFYPDDGRDAVSLTEYAEEQMFSARASGVPVADGTPEPVGGGFSA
jgi:GGDEF domain-containing protein